MSTIICPKCGSSAIKERKKQTPKERNQDNKNRMRHAYKCETCKGLFGRVYEYKEYSPEYQCYQLEFTVGGFRDGYKTIQIEQADGYANITVYPPVIRYDGIQYTAHIPLSDWEDIKDDLFNQLFVLSWKKNYMNHDVMDGTQWEVILTFDNRKPLKISGSNDYPILYNQLLDLVNPYFDLLGVEIAGYHTLLNKR